MSFVTDIKQTETSTKKLQGRKNAEVSHQYLAVLKAAFTSVSAARRGSRAKANAWPSSLCDESTVTQPCDMAEAHKTPTTASLNPVSCALVGVGGAWGGPPLSGFGTRQLTHACRRNVGPWLLLPIRAL